METDIIYYIDKNINSNNFCACKIGSTRNIIARMSTYTTLSIEPVIPTYYYKINKNCYEIDDLIQFKFKDYNTRKLGFKGGTELYDLNYVNNEKLETFFKENKIEFVKYNGDNIKNEIYKKTANMTDNDYEKIIEENKRKNQLKELRLKKSLQNTSNKIIKESLVDYSKFLPREDQEMIINKACSHFLNEDKGLFILMCGVGKTLISLWITMKLKLNKIIIGVPNTLLLNQWEKVFVSLFKNIPYIVVASGIDEENIIKFLKINNKQCILITTYSSSNKVVSAIKKNKFIFDMKINDEVHHLTSFNMDFEETTKKYI